MHRYSTYFIFVCCLPHFICCAVPLGLGLIGATTYINIFDFEQKLSWYENFEIYILILNLILLIFFLVLFKNSKKSECSKKKELISDDKVKKKKSIVINIIILSFFNVVNFSVFFLES